MKNKLIAATLFAFASMISGAAFAQQQDAPAPAAQDATAIPEPVQGKRIATGTAFVSGGSSTAEKAGMRTLAKDYNFKLAFMSSGSGKPMGEVKLKAVNVKTGKVALSGTSDGACIFANLPAGAYRVLTERNGVKMDRTVKVSNKKSPGTVFYSGAGKKLESGCW